MEKHLFEYHVAKRKAFFNDFEISFVFKRNLQIERIYALYDYLANQLLGNKHIYLQDHTFNALTKKSILSIFNI